MRLVFIALGFTGWGLSAAVGERVVLPGTSPVVDQATPHQISALRALLRSDRCAPALAKPVPTEPYKYLDWKVGRAVKALSLGPNGDLMAVAFANGSYGWVATADAKLHRGEIQTTGLHTMLVLPETGSLVFFDRRRQLRFVDYRFGAGSNHHEYPPIQLDTNAVELKVSGNGQWLAAMAGSVSADSLDLVSLEPLQREANPMSFPLRIADSTRPSDRDRVSAFDLSPSRRHSLLVAGTWGGAVRVFDLANPSQSTPVALRPDSRAEDSPFSIRFSPRGDRLAIGTRKGNLSIWKLTPTTPMELHSLGVPMVTRGKAPVLDAVFSKDGSKLLVMTGASRDPELWNAQTGERIGFIELRNRLGDPVGFVEGVFGAGDRTVILRADREVAVIDARTLNPVERIKRTTADFTTLASSGDGEKVAVGLRDGRVLMLSPRAFRLSAQQALQREPLATP